MTGLLSRKMFCQSVLHDSFRFQKVRCPHIIHKSKINGSTRDLLGTRFVLKPIHANQKRGATKTVGQTESEEEKSWKKSSCSSRARIQKIKWLRSNGGEPYTSLCRGSLTTDHNREYYGNIINSAGSRHCEVVYVVGRLVELELTGNEGKLRLLDETGDLTVSLNRNKMDDSLESGFAVARDFIDVGDFVGVEIVIGGHSLSPRFDATSLRLLFKPVKPLPEEFHDIDDIEKRCQERHLDLIAHPESREIFRVRSKVISAVRNFLEDRGYLEVDTPILHPVCGGADANPFYTRHEQPDRVLTLRVSPEHHLKKMMVGGFERVFEIGRVFRNEGVSASHNPEFTTVEFYEAYTDYYSLMDVTEDLIRSCVKRVLGKTKVEYDGQELDFESPFKRISMADSVAEVSGIDLESYESLDEAKKALLEALREEKDYSSFEEKIKKASSFGELTNEAFEAVVESTLWRPTIIMDYPVEISPYAKAHPMKLGKAQRFEVFVAGRELANGSAELTDAMDLRHRLEKKQQLNENNTTQSDINYHEVDHDFLSAVEYGLPPSAGTAMGIDRKMREQLTNILSTVHPTINIFDLKNCGFDLDSN